ncbi:MAG: hypothetical protein H7Z17_14550 [Fuerstia sp.]|nr:hypothetical protein [Fuerstiella sp.]
MGGFIGGLITVVVIIVGLIQALAPVFKSISEAIEKSNRPPGQNPALPGGMNANNPASFLPEMTQQSAPRPASTTSRPANVPQPRNAKGTARRQQQRPGQQQGSAPARPSAKPVGGDRSPGTGVGAHVDSFIGQHVKSHIGHQLADAVKTDIGDQVRHHLGEDRNKPTSPTAATTHGSAAAGDLLLALRSPEGVRQAILMSEILTKPKALRRS